MVIGHWIWQAELKAEHPDQYRGESLRVVRDMRRSLTTFLRWKVDQYRNQNPDVPPPTEVILKAHILPDPSPGTSRLDRPAAFYIPVALWQPSETPSDDCLPLEAWDPRENRFVKLPAVEARP